MGLFRKTVKRRSYTNQTLGRDMPSYFSKSKPERCDCIQSGLSINPTPNQGKGEYPNGPETNLIQIKQKDIHSVPEVWYKGQQVDNELIDVSFYWRTYSDDDSGACDVRVKYIDDNEAVVTRIQKRNDSHD